MQELRNCIEYSQNERFCFDKHVSIKKITIKIVNMIQYEERQRHTDRERGGGGGAEGAKRPRNFIYCPGLN